jgi:D-glycerate 3-kinase
VRRSSADFYLPYTELKGLAERCPDNPLLQGRGPPGTHDLALLSHTLLRLRNGPLPSPLCPVHLPIFDRSQHRGFGDRSEESVRIDTPVDVFLLEGWSLGYTSLSEVQVDERRRNGRTASLHSSSTIQQINRNLGFINEVTRGIFDCHVAIHPLSYDFVYAWRMEQEHMMKRANGGKGMSDEEVVAFVDRYMPVYEVFGETGPDCSTLRLTFGEHREVA